jgi:hypothetical protein
VSTILNYAFEEAVAQSEHRLHRHYAVADDDPLGVAYYCKRCREQFHIRTDDINPSNRDDVLMLFDRALLEFNRYGKCRGKPLYKLIGNGPWFEY